MKFPTSMPRLKSFRFPREIVAYAVWAYNRFALSTADVEDLLTEHGVIVSPLVSAMRTASWRNSSVRFSPIVSLLCCS